MFEDMLREEFDKIMKLTDCDAEQTYIGMAEVVKAWGCRQFADGMIAGREK